MYYLLYNTKTYNSFSTMWGNFTSFSMNFASANNVGSLKFLPINCKLIGSPLLDSLIGTETAGIPIKISYL